MGKNLKLEKIVGDNLDKIFGGVKEDKSKGAKVKCPDCGYEYLEADRVLHFLSEPQCPMCAKEWMEYGMPLFYRSKSQSEGKSV